MTKIKICGITSINDVNIINKYKPEYAGFVFANGKRKLNIAKAEELCSLINKDILKVGVFVNEDISNVIEACTSCKLDIIQLHGDEPLSYVKSLKEKLGREIGVWKAFRLIDEVTLESIEKYKEADLILVDCYDPNAYGGTGKEVNIELASKIIRKDIVLAGGLNIDNVREAILKVRPYAIDVSSGVEFISNELGMGLGKDEKLVSKFIEIVRNIN